MFEMKTYSERRKKLREQVKSGLILLAGNGDSSMDCRDNCYEFRQDSSFRYYFEYEEPELAGVVDVESGEEYLFGNDLTVEEIVWRGYQSTVKDKAEKIGVNNTGSMGDLAGLLKKGVEQGRMIHYLPPYRAEHLLKLSEWLGRPVGAIAAGASEALIRAVVAQRSIKTQEEIEEIEKAVNRCHVVQAYTMAQIRPGKYEHELVAGMEHCISNYGYRKAFPIILTTRGEILHNLDHSRQLAKGQLVLNDSGVQVDSGYVGDLTRTCPVSGRFDARQKEIYTIVLKAETRAIEAISPGIAFRDIHLLACRVIVEGLQNTGLMKGDIDEAVAVGAHALFFPCGLGHMMGLDTHDMEALGEDYVGYDDHYKRSDQFGLNRLRMGKKLEKGHVVTVEPGIYFIPPLIERWRSEGRHADFIYYDRLEKYLDFGGVRIEDDIEVTDAYGQMIGGYRARTIREIEEIYHTFN